MNKKHLLVVEDDRSVCFSLKVLLENAGYWVDTTTDGNDAWSLIKTNKYQLILSDINLPGMNGKEILEGMRR